MNYPLELFSLQHVSSKAGRHFKRQHSYEQQTWNSVHSQCKMILSSDENNQIYLTDKLAVLWRRIKHLGPLPLLIPDAFTPHVRKMLSDDAVKVIIFGFENSDSPTTQVVTHICYFPSLLNSKTRLEKSYFSIQKVVRHSKSEYILVLPNHILIIYDFLTNEQPFCQALLHPMWPERVLSLLLYKSCSL